ncbi:MAG: hypothetical protein AB7G12_17805 [Thermoanaerobaculia bacterium]
MSDPHALEVARRELQRLGYLSHRVERFLLSDAVSVAADPRAFALLAGKVGLLAGTLLAFATTLALGVANGLFAVAPPDLLPLFLHLWAPLVLLSAAGFVGVAGGFYFALRLFPRRSLEVLILGVAFLATGLLFGGAVYRARGLLLELDRSSRLAAAIALPLLAAGFAKLVANGLLSLAIRLTRMTPRQRLVSRRTILSVLALALGGLGAVALAWPQRPAASPPASLPSAPGRAVALIALDGILPGEFDYLLARGALPHLARRLESRGIVVPLRRPEGLEPAELWTTVATGVGAGRHGVGSVDGYRPLGLRTTLARSGPWRYWWRWVEQPLGLAEHRPLLSNRRQAFTFWELASRGGAPVAAINWWSTFPAAQLPGLVAAHGAFQLLADRAPGAVSPVAESERLAAEARATGPGAFGEAIHAALPPDPAAIALERAVLPDRFYRALAASEGARGPRALALYLPAVDLLAEEWVGGDVAFADLVRLELEETDELVGALSGFEALVIVTDPGRRGGAEGRVLLAGVPCTAPASAMAPEAVAAALLRLLGLPQSAELPDPPASCDWPAPPGRVATFGAPESGPEPAGGADEYLKSHRALGYL